MDDEVSCFVCRQDGLDGVGCVSHRIVSDSRKHGLELL